MSTTATKKKLKPLGNKLVVKKLEAKDQTEGGIYLPSGSQEKPLEGLVIAVGPGSMNDKGERQSMDIKEGDLVLFPSFIHHYTRPSQSDSERIVLSFNLNCYEK